MHEQTRGYGNGIRHRVIAIVAGIGAVLDLVSVSIGKELVIADRGKSDDSIIVAVDATMQDNYDVAQMLKWDIRELSGADFPIVPDTASLSENELVVRFNRHRMTLGAGRSRSFTPSSGSA